MKKGLDFEKVGKLRAMSFSLAVRKGKYREVRAAFPAEISSRVEFLEKRAASFFQRDMSRARDLRTKLTARADKTARSAQNRAMAALETLRALGAPIPAELEVVANGFSIAALREPIEWLDASYATPESARWQ